MTAESDHPNSPGSGSQEWHAHTPRISDALRKGISVSVTTWGGRELGGLVCDRDQSGLMVDVRDSEGDVPVYIFLPWSSVEQIEIRELTPRRVKFLPS